MLEDQDVEIGLKLVLLQPVLPDIDALIIEDTQPISPETIQRIGDFRPVKKRHNHGESSYHNVPATREVVPPTAFEESRTLHIVAAILDDRS